VTPGFDGKGVAALVKALGAQDAQGVLVGPSIGPIAAADGTEHQLKYSVLTTSSVLFDAIWVAGGENAGMWTGEEDAIDFVRDAYKHCKAVGASGDGIRLLQAADIPAARAVDPEPPDDATILAPAVSAAVARRFIDAMAMHRLWTRQPELHLPTK
jgi:catalase